VLTVIQYYIERHYSRGSGVPRQRGVLTRMLDFQRRGAVAGGRTA